MRSALSGLCGLLAALLLPLALVSVWLHTVVADTDAYLARVDPLAAEEQVRDAVEELLVEIVLQRVDLAALGARLELAAGYPELALDLPGDLDERLEELREQVGPLLEEAGGDRAAAAEEVVRRVVVAVVGSDAFPDLWSTAQRAGHREVVSVLDSPDPLRAGEQVVVPLDAFVDAVETQLAGFGLPVDGTLEGLSGALPLAAAEDLEPAREVYRILEPLWLLLPVAAAGLALLSLGLARRRLRTLAVLGGLASLLCLGLLVFLGLGRGLLLGTSRSAAAELLTGRTADAVSADLRDAAVTGVLVGLAAVVVAAVLGAGLRAVRRTGG